MNDARVKLLVGGYKMKWNEVKIKTTAEAVDAVTNILYEIGITGVVIEDPNDPVVVSKIKGQWDYFEKSVFDFEYDGIIVKAYLEDNNSTFDTIETIKEKVAALKSYNIDIGIGEITTSEIFEEDYANEWKKYYKPRKVAKNIVIKPTWEPYKSEKDDLVIEMDPGGAFGTGTHETTILCIQALEKYVKEDTLVYDIGCGSGILGITAAKLGANNVYAVDLDEAAVSATKSNALLNHVEDKVTVLHGNLMDLLSEPADIVVANIIADVIIFLADSIPNFMHDDSIFIASGIIHAKKMEVVEALKSNGLEILSVDEMGEWASVTSRKKSAAKS